MKKIIFMVLALVLLTSCKATETNTEVSQTTEPTSTVTATIEPTATPTPTPIPTPTPKSTSKSKSNKTSKSTTKTTSSSKSTTVNSASSSGGDNKSVGWGFVKVKGSKPNVPAATQELFKKYDTYYMDPREGKVLYLTFDEGYENGYTAPILDTLKKCGVPAAFFITGSYLDREQDLVRRMIEEGHIVGNHTENHPNLPKLSSTDKMKAELTKLDDKFYNIFGKHMKYMRPPEGAYSERVLSMAKDAGYKTMLWSFAYKDWEQNAVRGSKYAFDAVTPYLHSGCIILLHAVSKDNSDALEDIINYAKEAGYVFKSLDDLP